MILTLRHSTLANKCDTNCLSMKGWPRQTLFDQRVLRSHKSSRNENVLSSKIVVLLFEASLFDTSHLDSHWIDGIVQRYQDLWQWWKSQGRSTWMSSWTSQSKRWGQECHDKMAELTRTLDKSHDSHNIVRFQHKNYCNNETRSQTWRKRMISLKCVLLSPLTRLSILRYWFSASTNMLIQKCTVSFGTQIHFSPIGSLMVAILSRYRRIPKLHMYLP